LEIDTARRLLELFITVSKDYVPIVKVPLTVCNVKNIEFLV